MCLLHKIHKVEHEKYKKDLTERCLCEFAIHPCQAQMGLTEFVHFKGAWGLVAARTDEKQHGWGLLLIFFASFQSCP